jgi:chorismate mutase/prephenate dehydratase
MEDNRRNFIIKNELFLEKISKRENSFKTNNIIERIICKQDEKNNIISFQGLPFSYSECAAKILFKNKILVNKESFEDVFKDVYEDMADFGVVPMENSTAGYINDIYDLLLKYDLFINYNYIMKIDHCLAGTLHSKLEDIDEVYSHPQAIMQCKNYLDKNNLKAVNESNTAVAASKISNMNDKRKACICSPEAAAYYGLKIIESSINLKQNYTRFGAISKHLYANENHNRISIVFKIPHEVGSLKDMMSIFSYYNVNLTSIYSRPDMESPWKYLFYLDFEGCILYRDIQIILNMLYNELPFIKILGSCKL